MVRVGGWLIPFVGGMYLSLTADSSSLVNSSVVVCVVIINFFADIADAYCFIRGVDVLVNSTRYYPSTVFGPPGLTSLVL